MSYEDDDTDFLDELQHGKEVPVVLEVAQNHVVPTEFFSITSLRLLIDRFHTNHKAYNLPKKLQIPELPDNTELRIGTIQITFTFEGREIKNTFACLIPLDTERQSICSGIFTLSLKKLVKKPRLDDGQSSSLESSGCEFSVQALVTYDLTATACMQVAMKKMETYTDENKTQEHMILLMNMISALFHNLRERGSFFLNLKSINLKRAYFTCHLAVQKSNLAKLRYDILALSLGSALKDMKPVSSKRQKTESIFLPPNRSTPFKWKGFVLETLEKATDIQSMLNLIDSTTIPPTILEDSNFPTLVQILDHDLTNLHIDHVDAWKGLQLLNFKLLKQYLLKENTGNQKILMEEIQKYIDHDGTPPTLFKPDIVKITHAEVCANGISVLEVPLAQLPHGVLFVFRKREYGVVYVVKKGDKNVVMGSYRPCLKDLYPWPKVTFLQDRQNLDAWVHSVKNSMYPPDLFKSLISTLLNYCPEVLYHMVKDITTKPQRDFLKEQWHKMKEMCTTTMKPALYTKTLDWVDKLRTSVPAFILMINLFRNVYKEYHIFHMAIQPETVILTVSPWATPNNQLVITETTEHTQHESGYGQKCLWE